MKLQFLVPHFKETPEEVAFLLNSLNLQCGVKPSEYGVIIVYDGEEATPLPEEQWKRIYPFDITFIHMEHKGLCAARNRALEEATADWVMFCDADDMFCDLIGVYIIFAEMNKGYDILIDCFLEELKRKGTDDMIYIPHDKDFTFVHGKVYKREYLDEIDVRFDERLTLCEDSNFNLIATNYTKNIGYCSMPFYLWKWRDTSTTRKEWGYYVKAYPQFMQANDYTIQRFLKDGHEDLARFHVCAMVVDLYFLMNGDKWLEPDLQKERLVVGQKFKEYLAKYSDFWTTMDEDIINKLATNQRYASLSTYPEALETILNWCRNIHQM